MRQPSVRAKVYTLENRNKLSTGLVKAHKKNPEWAKRSAEIMKQANPSRDPKVRKKIEIHWKKFGHPLSRNRGGNGKGPTQAERTLWAALGGKWKLGHVVPTKKREKGYPSHYKLDLALRKERVWIEVDGWSHSLPGRKEVDRRKEKRLKELGWKGLRFSNKQVMENLPTVLSSISKFLDTHRITQTGF